MQYRALDVFLGPGMDHVGLLFQYGSGPNAITRLIPNEGFWMADAGPVFSKNAAIEDPAVRAQFLMEYTTQPFFNGEGEKLPPFFFNLLPEGPLRRHLELIGGLGKDDDFGLLALCGTDLPGAVYAQAADINPSAMAGVVTQNNDALEMTVTPMPLPEATSLSGVQPKLSLVKEGGRYVARTKNTGGVHIIAKLPTVDYPLLPQVEKLSMDMAQAAGVEVCEVELAQLADMHAEHEYLLGDERQFLSVRRFDRTPEHHVHCEDFAQILGVPPAVKYTHERACYSNILNVLVNTPSLGTEAAHEMIRRIVVNDMLGNFDGHIKNYGLLYPDGRTPVLSPAYDVVAYAAYVAGRGHALRFVPQVAAQQRVSPLVVRALCNAVPGLMEPKVKSIITKCVHSAYEAWPDMIQGSDILDVQKTRMLKHFNESPLIDSLARRKRALTS